MLTSTPSVQLLPTCRVSALQCFHMQTVIHLIAGTQATNSSFSWRKVPVSGKALRRRRSLRKGDATEWRTKATVPPRSILSAAVHFRVQEELDAFVQQKISAKSFLLEGHAERFLHLGRDHSYATIPHLDCRHVPGISFHRVVNPYS